MLNRYLLLCWRVEFTLRSARRGVMLISFRCHDTDYEYQATLMMPPPLRFSRGAPLLRYAC